MIFWLIFNVLYHINVIQEYNLILSTGFKIILFSQKYSKDIVIFYQHGFKEVVQRFI